MKNNITKLEKELEVIRKHPNFKKIIDVIYLSDLDTLLILMVAILLGLATNILANIIYDKFKSFPDLSTYAVLIIILTIILVFFIKFKITDKQLDKTIKEGKNK